MEMQKARQFLLEKSKREEESAEKRFNDAGVVFQQITEFIVDNYHPEEIRKCGSLLFRESFRENSDIDIAVRGIDFESLIKLFLQIEDMSSFKIHLIDLDDLDGPDQVFLLKYSEIVYRAGRSSKLYPRLE